MPLCHQNTSTQAHAYGPDKIALPQHFAPSPPCHFHMTSPRRCSTYSGILRLGLRLPSRTCIGHMERAAAASATIHHLPLRMTLTRHGTPLTPLYSLPQSYQHTHRATRPICLAHPAPRLYFTASAIDTTPRVPATPLSSCPTPHHCRGHVIPFNLTARVHRIFLARASLSAEISYSDVARKKLVEEIVW